MLNYFDFLYKSINVKALAVRKVLSLCFSFLANQVQAINGANRGEIVVS